MACEPSELLERELALLEGLAAAAGKHDIETDYTAATKRVAAMRIAKTHDIDLQHFGGVGKSRS